MKKGYWRWLGKGCKELLSGSRHFIFYCLACFTPGAIVVGIILYFDFPKPLILLALPLMSFIAIVYLTYGDYKEELKNPTKR